MEKQVIQSVGFRNIEENGEITGFQLKIRLPYYRGASTGRISPMPKCAPTAGATGTPRSPRR